MYLRLATLTLTCVIVASCSSRVVYQPPANAASPTATVNINSASAGELERLPHIGPKTAAAIVEFRTRNGPFRRPEMLLQIRGMSESKFAEIAPFIKTK